MRQDHEKIEPKKSRNLAEGKTGGLKHICGSGPFYNEEINKTNKKKVQEEYVVTITDTFTKRKT